MWKNTGVVRHNGCTDRLSVRVQRWKCRQSDRALVRKFKRGDPEALLAIYQRCRDYLLSVAMAMVCDMDRAEDIVGINSIFHGPTDYLVARGQTILRAADYTNKDTRWAFPSFQLDPAQATQDLDFFFKTIRGGRRARAGPRLGRAAGIPDYLFPE